jgi:protease I
MKIAVLMTQGFEDSEAREPLQALASNGFEIDIISPTAGEQLKGMKGEFTVKSHKSIGQVKAADYQGLVIPGGHSPELLRAVEGATQFVKEFGSLNRTIAAVCHGPQLLISAELVRGKKMTCYKTVAIDLKNAGANYLDAPLVIDGNLITSRQPSDLPQFCQALVEALQKVPATRAN